MFNLGFVFYWRRLGCYWRRLVFHRRSLGFYWRRLRCYWRRLVFHRRGGLGFYWRRLGFDWRSLVFHRRSLGFHRRSLGCYWLAHLTTAFRRDDPRAGEHARFRRRSDRRIAVVHAGAQGGITARGLHTVSYTHLTLP